MSDRSSINELSSDARAILDAGRDADGARDLERARVRRALIAKIAIGGGATLAASSTAAASGTSGAVAGSVAATGSAAVGTSVAVGFPLAKVLVPLAIMFGAGVGGTVAWRSQQRVMAPVVVAAPVVAPAAPILAPVVEPVGPIVAPTVSPVRAVHHAHVAAAARAEAPTNRLAEETALLAASNAELRGGDARRALSLLDDYDRRYPGGVLREEVLATRVIARCQMGLTPDATSRQAADLFLRRHPASPLAPRVRSSCGH
jgi:hypothetical protein